MRGSVQRSGERCQRSGGTSREQSTAPATFSQKRTRSAPAPGNRPARETMAMRSCMSEEVPSAKREEFRGQRAEDRGQKRIKIKIRIEIRKEVGASGPDRILDPDLDPLLTSDFCPLSSIC